MFNPNPLQIICASNEASFSFHVLNMQDILGTNQLLHPKFAPAQVGLSRSSEGDQRNSLMFAFLRYLRTNIPSRCVVSRSFSHGEQQHKINGLPIVYHPAYSAPVLAEGHRFPMGVFRRIYDRLLQQSIIRIEQVHVPECIAPDDQISLVHTDEYLTAFSTCTLDDKRVRRIGFGETTRTPVLVERTKAEVAGTLLTAELCLKTGLACNTAGGTHHAFPDFGSGFCIINDLAVTAKVLLGRGLVSRILILDLDVHQGDGTAAIFEDDPRVFTLSVHCQSNFPARKQKSDLDVGLPDGTDDDQYLKMIADVLPETIRSFRPDIVLYDAGVDPHKEDALGKLSISDFGLFRREMLVMDTCLSEGVPLACYTGGGYDNSLDILAERHMLMHRAAMQMWSNYNL